MVSKIKIALTYATIISTFAAMAMFMITVPEMGNKDNFPTELPVATTLGDSFQFVGKDFSQVFLPEDNAVLNGAVAGALAATGGAVDLELAGLALGARSMLSGCFTAASLPEATVENSDCVMQHQVGITAGVLCIVSAALLLQIVLTTAGASILKPLMVATVPAHAGALAILITSIKSLGVKSSVSTSFEKFGGAIIGAVVDGNLQPAIDAGQLPPTLTAANLGIGATTNVEVEIKSEFGATILLASGLLMATAAFSTLVSIIALKKHAHEWEEKGMSASVMA